MRKVVAFLTGQLVLLCLVAAGALAQTAASGTITGTVTDPSGSSVPGAGVAVKNADTGGGRSLQTNDAGVYSATFLQPGHYEITITKAGFTTIERKGVTVEVGRTISLDFKLTVASGNAAVTVTSEAPLVDAEKTDVSQEIDQNMVKDLPLVGRRWDSFVLLTPGVVSDGALVSYRGLSGLYNNNSVDGANNNQSFLSESRGRSAATTGAPYIYSLDSIDQFQVQASNYSAEFGQAAGGVVNAVTKSGTNALHGDLFYYLRYPSLNALDPVNKSNGILTQSVHQFQQFGGSVGGAAIKDKLFYFFTYDGSRKVFPVAYISSSRFPLTCPTQLSIAQCAAANGYLSSLVGSYPRTGVNDVGFGKIDYQINTANRASLAFNLEDYHAPNSYSSSATYSNLSVTANGPIVLHERFLVGTLESTLSPNAVNKFLFQWGMDNEITGANSGGPSVSVASVMTYGMPNALPRGGFPNERRWQQSDTMSVIAGKHTIKFGVDVNEIHEVISNLFQGGGIYSYGGSASAAFSNWALDVFGINANDGIPVGKHYTSFTQVTDPITGKGRDDWWEQDFGGFIEDSWKATRKLTINMGLRYDLQLTPQPPRPNISTPLNAALTSRINEDTNNFGPRIGLAWSPIKDTVVRAGYGMFYGKTTNSTFYAYRVENGIYQQTFSLSCSAASCPGPGFPNLLFTPPGPAPAAPFPGALTPTVTPISLPLSTQLTRGLTRDFVNPLVHEGDLTIERQLPGNMSITAAYLFSRALHLPVFVDANLGPAVGTHTYTVLGATGAASTVTVPWYPAGDRIDTATGDVLTGYSVLNSWYNALTLTLKRPMSHGLQYTFNYTFAKSIDDGAVGGSNGTFNGTDYTIDPHNQKQENSLSDLNQKHRFTGNVIFAPTYFHKVSNKAVRAIADGWAYSAVGTFFTGLPVFALISGNASGGVDYGMTGGTVTNSGGSTGGRPPQVGRNVFIGPGMENIDFRIQRDFVMKEKYKLSFLGEAFNVFNHTNITAVNGTAFNYSATCNGQVAGTNGCIVANAAFLAPTSSTASNGLYGARQLQVSARFSF